MLNNLLYDVELKKRINGVYDLIQDGKIKEAKCVYSILKEEMPLNHAELMKLNALIAKQQCRKAVKLSDSDINMMLHEVISYLHLTYRYSLDSHFVETKEMAEDRIERHRKIVSRLNDLGFVSPLLDDISAALNVGVSDDDNDDELVRQYGLDAAEILKDDLLSDIEDSKS